MRVVNFLLWGRRWGNDSFLNSPALQLRRLLCCTAGGQKQQSCQYNWKKMIQKSALV